MFPQDGKRLAKNFLAPPQRLISAMHSRLRQRRIDPLQRVPLRKADPEFIVECQLERGIQSFQLLERLAPDEARGLADEAFPSEQLAPEIAHRILRKPLAPFVHPPGIAVHSAGLGFALKRTNRLRNRARQE